MPPFVEEARERREVVAGHAFDPLDAPIAQVMAQVTQVVRVGFDGPRREPFLDREPGQE